MNSDIPGCPWETCFSTTTRLALRLENELKKKSSLSLPEYNVLLHTERAGKNGIRLGMLARSVVFSPSRLTHTLHRLVERGYITRTLCSQDKRGGIITLTRAGNAALRKATSHHADLLKKLLLDDMTPEESAVFEKVFQRIRQRLDEEEFSTF
ncbi:MarR family winged helix-turn-helix transcriptional regulator [Schaalia sp. lx-260]|uniref:MarR family winged helix-turn-helix transcriptional regulator n=1 Tax=Schaalia sp. lx-260 TaxID=2899082 RepID=UPI001E51BF0C|nr:MarR family transcriptional regulator [Schaalia sp. lx-260]MCD4549964.1 MarR family transcriptional regulator [Schaalia sp. lx-260]